ncbi:exopolysaccharide biosynthesis polyprenyl glycosylphosphotransferase [Kosmotoga olearia]|uniref:Exopolysaccharide biosynthesis polyprenyl glycosylphosphotransferase n=1 Tax=Kosmotoga olearia (strain ATCC BAA-1733 / DSM 21960 / TBF 19.5.1) TaxID=521045 RepID=C5CDC1_KOSOT|nr:exopolysaccharide biosynthesis polyprenyl glycosylphosphotransferase [Kosmotoga olearia]ACR79984.1 exopolysaccharide biosynthesis polyprenyl glycosylphosphotransferase [Kosmotoga olearia TBF 19.5.1]
MKRLREVKYSLALFYFIILYIIQSLLLEWDISLFIQATILNISLLLGIYAFRGFDNFNIQSLNSSLVSYSIGSLIGALFSLMIVAFFKAKLPKEVFITALALSGVIFPIISTFTIRKVLSMIPPKRYLVIGNESEIGEIIREIEKASMEKVKIYGYMNPSSVALEQALSLSLFDSILVADQKLSRSVESILEKADSQGKSVEFLPLIVEQTLKRIPIELIDKFKEYYEIQFSSVKETPSKRVLDLFISVIAMIILSPVYLVIYLAILLDDGLPIIFKQMRVGLNGSNFIMHKFRSMKKDAESTGAKYATQQENNVTRIGKLMRPVRLDEIPQFYDILIGKMSFVGPRPEQPEFAKELAEALPYYNYRNKLKPGLTGWAQTNYKYAATIEEQAKKLSYDLYYIKNRSLLLDLLIILRTFETVVFRKGAK